MNAPPENAAIVPEEDNLVEILEELNAKIEDESSGEKITLGQLLGLMQTKGITLCILVLAMPSFFPGLLPPFPSILAVPMMIFGGQLVRQRNEIWLPRFIANVPIGRKVMGKIVTKFIYYLNKLPTRKHAEPFILHGKSEMFVGAMIILFAFIMFIPLPLTNFLPSVGAAFVALGVLKQSSLYTAIGMVIGVIGVIVGLTAVIGVISLI